jgi:hypothetical protein
MLLKWVGCCATQKRPSYGVWTVFKFRAFFLCTGLKKIGHLQYEKPQSIEFMVFSSLGGFSICWICSNYFYVPFVKIPQLTLWSDVFYCCAQNIGS